MPSPNLSVLVVDDEPDVQLLCRVNLQFEGFDVRIAEDGFEALAELERDPPDIVLLDVMMPRMDGWEVLARMKDDERFADLPVIMLTARVQEADQVRGWTEGVADYITKPFSPLQLSAAVRDTVRQQQADEAERREGILRKLRLLQGI